MTTPSLDLASVLVSPAAPGDGARIAAYVRDVVDEDLDTVPSRTVGTGEHYEEIIARSLAGPGAFLIAKAGGGVVGLLDLRVDDKRGRSHVAAFGMTVARTWRGRGLGRRLLETALLAARSWPQVCRVELEVVPWNAPAIALYQSFGFEIEGRKRKAIDLRGEPEDILLMALVW